MRPDQSVSIQQMMMALLKANPEAFINGNINGLKRGEILRMPDFSGIQSLTKQDAFEKAKHHNALWEDVRTAIAAAPSKRPVSTDTSQPAMTDESVTKPEMDEISMATTLAP